MTTACSICGKPLTDPVSMELGIGPVCYVKRKIEEAMNKMDNLFAPRSEFEYGLEDGILWIRDLGGIKSVTNDMENVLADIVTDLNSHIHDYHIMYLDSMKIWDGIRITRIEASPVKKFKRLGFEFFSINEKDFEKAKQKLLNSVKS